MKMISVIIKPFKVEEVRNALGRLGISGITLSEAKGFGHQKSRAQWYRGDGFMLEFVPKVELEVVIDAELVPRAVEAILAAAHTGKVGDGKIVVSDLEDIVRIRTGETGALAVA